MDLPLCAPWSIHSLVVSDHVSRMSLQSYEGSLAKVASNWLESDSTHLDQNRLDNGWIDDSMPKHRESSNRDESAHDSDVDRKHIQILTQERGRVKKTNKRWEVEWNQIVQYSAESLPFIHLIMFCVNLSPGHCMTNIEYGAWISDSLLVSSSHSSVDWFHQSVWRWRLRRLRLWEKERERERCAS